MTQNNTPEKRTKRVNFLLTPTIKDGITAIAAIKQVSLNDLANTTFQELITKYESQIQEYYAFIEKMNTSQTNMLLKSPTRKEHR